MMETLVKEYYTHSVSHEWRRLVRDAYQRLEFDTTMHFLAKYLPNHGLILDAGGGPGRYTVELARKQHDVVLLDLVAENLDFAKRQIKKAGVQDKVKDLIVGSIVDLSQFADNTFDAILCTGGALSHILNKQERNKVVSEAIRVAKRGAPIFMSVLSRLPVLVYVLTMSQDEIELPHFKQLRDSGDYFGGYGFTACHFFLPEELREVFTKEDVIVLEMVGLEGINSHHRKAVNQLARNKARWQEWEAIHHRTCTHPSVVGISEHMLIICRKN